MRERTRRRGAVAMVGLFGAGLFGVGIRGVLERPDNPSAVHGTMAVIGGILVCVALLAEALANDADWGK